jgi:hypothetical protein
MGQRSVFVITAGGILAAIFRVEGPIATLTIDNILEYGALVCRFHPRPNELCLVASDRLDWSRRGHESALKLWNVSQGQFRWVL